MMMMMITMVMMMARTFFFRQSYCVYDTCIDTYIHTYQYANAYIGAVNSITYKHAVMLGQMTRYGSVKMENMTDKIAELRYIVYGTENNMLSKWMKFRDN